jgi:hypothetical protein
MTKVFNDSELEVAIPPPWVSWIITAICCVVSLAVALLGWWLKP